MNYPTPTIYRRDTFRIPLDDDGAIVLLVEVEGQSGFDGHPPDEWLWSFVECRLLVDGEEREPSAWVERAVRAHWRDLPGMGDALMRWERGER
jgi:hypothetical protein